MTPTPVGMRCPECASERTRVTRGGVQFTRGRLGDSPATVALIAINVVVLLAELGTGSGGIGSASSPLIREYGLIGGAVADGQWYRIVTAGFLHAGLMHLAFNMIALWFIGEFLEPGIGTARFVMIYFTSLLAGSFGALLLSGDVENTVGASGAIFGIFGALFVIAQGRGLSGVAGQIGIILGINLLLTFTVSGISIGGHLGGLVAGAICGALVIAGERGHLGTGGKVIEFGGMAALAVISVIGALTVASPIPGITFAFLSWPL